MTNGYHAAGLALATILGTALAGAASAQQQGADVPSTPPAAESAPSVPDTVAPDATSDAAPGAGVAAAPADTPSAPGDDASPAGDATGSVAANAPGDATGDTAAPPSDFPTVAIADYVLGCMAANGNTYEALQQCSCSIDFIKAHLDYKSYETANTILQVRRDVGQRGIFYRDSNWAKSRVERLESLQAESTLRCF